MRDIESDELYVLFPDDAMNDVGIPSDFDRAQWGKCAGQWVNGSPHMQIVTAPRADRTFVRAGPDARSDPRDRAVCPQWTNPDVRRCSHPSMGTHRHIDACPETPNSPAG